MGGFLFCDLPEVEATAAAGRVVLTVMAYVAEYKGLRIVERTREALAAAKASGVKLDGTRPCTLQENAKAKSAAADRSEALRPYLAAIVAQGASPCEMA
jgi:DNA invertase Pin-like site-specific DNA recombinase